MWPKIKRKEIRGRNFKLKYMPILYHLILTQALFSFLLFWHSSNILSCNILAWQMGFPGSLAGKESSCKAGHSGLIPGLGRSPGGGHGNPLQYPGLENPRDRGAWRDTVHGVTKSWTRLSHLANGTTCLFVRPPLPSSCLNGGFSLHLEAPLPPS